MIYIYKLTTLQFVYESLNKMNPNQFHIYYNYPSDIINTAAVRQKCLDPPQPRTVTYGLKSLKYAGCILWNNIPIYIRDLLSKKVFKLSVKRHLISQYNNQSD